MAESGLEIYNQGYYYYSGTNGYPLNYNKALQCFQEAAELGVSDAMNYLGVFYENGKIVAQNSATAIEWYNRALAANGKNIYAAYNLASLYYNGKGVAKDMVKAYKYGKIAVDIGSGSTDPVLFDSCHLVGCILLTYYKKYNEAYPCFMKAAADGDIAEAWYNLGWLSEKGVAPSLNSTNNTKATRDGMARGFYERAAKKGMPEAMDAVGRLYASYSMYKEARPYLEKAASMGYEPAKKRLKMMGLAQTGSIWGLFK